MECRPYASDIKYQSQCVCGDEVYAITQQAAVQRAEHGALWCSGVLELVDGAGTLKYVYNPYSFQYLKQKLDSGTNSKLYEYLECIGMGEGACTQLDNVDEVFLQVDAQRHQPPISAHALPRTTLPARFLTAERF